jgi:hypothetical protein
MNLPGLLISSLLIAVSLPAQVILENEFVRVLDTDVTPRGLNPTDAHARGLAVSPSGEVKWFDPTTPLPRGTGPATGRVIRIEMKKDAPAGPPPAPDPLDALVVCKDTQTLLFENAWLRAIQDRGPAGATTPKHSHKRGLLITLSAYDSEVKIFPGGKVTQTRAKGGNVVWSEPVVHQVRNTGSTPTNAIRIEVK